MTSTSGVPPTQFATARGARIAWHEFGSGPTVVAIPPTAQNIEAAWEWPPIRAMFDHFGSFARFVQFDKRGTGASDRRSRAPGLDERVEDLRAVMDAAGIERAFLYGVSEGGPVCVMFAATYPDRVDGLILAGTGPFTSAAPESPEHRAEILERIQEYANEWGTEQSRVVFGFAPSLADDEAYRRWHQRYERLAASPASLAEMIEISLDVDVSDVLHRIDAPTLILHATRDRIIPVEWGRLLAAGIENATMIEYDSADHFSYADLDPWMPAFEQFVTGSSSPLPSPTASNGETSRPDVRITTLGRFEVSVDGVTVSNAEWGSRRARQLCKRLVAARGWPVRREELFELLWPDEVDLHKLGPRLSVQLSAVRRVLRGAVIADRDVVALDLDEVDCDVEDVLDSGDSVDRLLDAYGGVFLPSDLDEDWASGVRDETRSAFAAAVRERLATETGSPAERERLVRRLIDVDPWNDDAHRALVDLLRADGRPGDARAAHDAWASAMAELDIAVDPF